MNSSSDRRALPGIILVVIGLVLLVAHWFELTGAGPAGVG
jgi:hypothetical protein